MTNVCAIVLSPSNTSYLYHVLYDSLPSEILITAAWVSNFIKPKPTQTAFCVSQDIRKYNDS